VEATTIGGELWPLRDRTTTIAAMPTLAERFKTFHDYAAADLNQIYTAERLDRALKLEINELRSGLLLNDGTGRFEFRPLPALAQVSPGFGVAFCFADDDLNPDLYVVQNSFSPHRETGRMDGGLSVLLLGDGTGSFGPVWPNRSGLVIPDDAKGLGTIDLNADGADDFVVTVNNGRFRTFQSAVTKGRRLQFRLHGPKGNPAAVGSKLMVATSVGGRPLRHVAEIYAGGSYLSQSSPRISLPVGEGPVNVLVKWPDGSEQRTTLESSTGNVVELQYAPSTRN
jgi:hypothetical protein